MRPYINLRRDVRLNPRGPILIYERNPVRFLAVMDHLYPELLDASYSPLELKLCAFRSDGQFIGSFLVRQTNYGKCPASPRKNPWFCESGDWLLRAHLACVELLRTDFYVGWCRKGWNYGVLRYFQRMGLGAKAIFNDRSILTQPGTAETRADLEVYIAEARNNYTRVRQLATERMKTLDPEEILPRIEDFDQPVWSGSVEVVP